MYFVEYVNIHCSSSQYKIYLYIWIMVSVHNIDNNKYKYLLISRYPLLNL